MTDTGVDFLRFAAREASRYGDEPMVFLRELLQNARDAGARTITIMAGVRDGVDRIEVSDDGRGMRPGQASRFLLTLYASDKRGLRRTAGRFGVGFWSVLRFEPDRIEIASKPPGANAGWELVLDDALAVRHQGSRSMEPGTVVVLERAARGENLEDEVWRRVRSDARHLRSRTDPESLIRITVNGRVATEPMAVVAPGHAFRGRGLRGVVSLGSNPEITILAHGIRVRSAAGVEDLMVNPKGFRRKRSGPAPRGLSPRVVVDSDRLSVLMDRSDVAQDRRLAAVVSVVRSEIRRLQQRELNRLAPPSLLRRLMELRPRGWAAWAAAAGFVAAVAVSVPVARNQAPPRPLPNPAAVGATDVNRRPYSDRSSRYGGPVADPIGSVPFAPELAYRPASESPWFAAFLVNGFRPDGSPLRPEEPLRRAPAGQGGAPGRLEVTLPFQASGPVVRLPVPTGHLVDPASVRINGRSIPLWLTASGEPACRVGQSTEGLLEYGTMSGRLPKAAKTRWPELKGVDDLTRRIEALPPDQRVETAVGLVRQWMAPKKPEAERLPARTSNFLGRLVERGGGDCDVVNSVLGALLAQSGLRTRLAVGWIGRAGRLDSGLHAWVEVDLDGWVPVDASTPAPASRAEEPEETLPTPNGPMRAGRTLDRRLFWIGGGVLCLGLVFLWWRTRIRRNPVEPASSDPGMIVESLLHDRSGWRPSAWSRRLIATIPAGRCSPADAERAAADRRLFSARSPRAEVPRLRKRGAVVLDRTTGAGRTAAQTFGARDLDRWAALWERAKPDSVGDRLRELAEQDGLELEARLSDPDDPLDEATGLDDGRTIRVVVPFGDLSWNRCAATIRADPELALFMAADLALGSVPGLRNDARIWLSKLARTVWKRGASVRDGGRSDG